MKDLVSLLLIRLFSRIPSEFIIPVDGDSPFDSRTAKVVAQGWMPGEGKVVVYLDPASRRFAAVSRTRFGIAERGWAEQFIGRFNPSIYYELFR